MTLCFLCRRVELLPSDNQTVPGIYLVGEAGMPSLIINFAVTVVHPRNPGKSILCGKASTLTLWYGTEKRLLILISEELGVMRVELEEPAC